MYDATSEELQELHTFCVRMLKNYIEEATKTCSILTEIREFPISTEVRQRLVTQRQAENAAHDDYQIARKKLFDVARWEWE